MFQCVINGKVAVEVTKETKGAFYHKGAYYLYERDFEKLKNPVR